MKQEVPSADVNSQTPVAGCERSGTSVRKTPANSPGRLSSSRERRTCPSPARMPQCTAVQQDDSCLAVGGSSPADSLAKSASGEGSSLPINRRRSARSVKVTQSEELIVDNQKSVASPKCPRAEHVSPLRQSLGHVSPIRQTPRSKSVKSPERQHVPVEANSNSSQPLRSSPRRPVSSHVSGGHAMKSAGADGDPLHVSESVSPQKIASSTNISIGQVTKSVDAKRNQLHITDNDDNDGHKPLSSLSKQLHAVPDEVALLFGTAKPDKKRTQVRNRRKSSGQPVEKRTRVRFRSLEPIVQQKSPRAGRPRRKSDIVGIRAKIPSDSAQSLPTPEDSGRQLRERRKQSNDNQCQPTLEDKEVKNIEEKDDQNLVQSGKESASKREMRDGDVSSVTGVSDSKAVAASSDDVRTLQLSQFCYMFVILKICLLALISYN